MIIYVVSVRCQWGHAPALVGIGDACRMEDMASRRLASGTLVDLVCSTGGRRRIAPGPRSPLPVPAGCAAVYFPETNVLVPIGLRAAGAGTPAYKSVSVSVYRAGGASGEGG